MNALLIAAFLSLLSPQNDKIRINVDTSSGATISGQRTFRVTVDSPTAINQVEFYVGGDLRDTETSTPYLFPLDTIEQGDGDVKVRFKAYTVENQSAETTLTLHIDNKLAAGPAFHVTAGQSDLEISDWPDAINEGRIVMKLDPHNNDGRMILSRAFLGLGTLDKAQQYAEDAIAQDDKDDPALQLLAGIQLRRAFNTFSKEGTDRSEVLSSISDAFTAAVDARHKSLDLEVDAIGAPTGPNLIPYTDAVLREERYSLAIAALEKPFGLDPSNLAVANRLAFALLRSGRFSDAITTLLQAKTAGPLDAYSNAVLAAAYLQVNRPDDADKAIQDGAAIDPDNLGLRTAQAFIALKRNKQRDLSSIVADLSRDQAQRGSVNYFLMAFADQQQRFEDARLYFETAALAEPNFPDIYIEQANYSIGLAQTQNLPKADRAEAYREATMYYQVALEARPEAADALAGLAVVALFQNDMTDALKYAQAARDAAPNIATGHYVLSAINSLTGNLDAAQAEMKQAVALDKGNLDGVELPKAADVWKYLKTSGRIPVIAAP
jgi:predicted Zn-dependent protease